MGNNFLIITPTTNEDKHLATVFGNQRSTGGQQR